MAVHITGPRVSKDGKKSYYLRKGFARDPETGKQDVAAITWHPPVGLKPAEEKRQLTLFAAQWEEHEIEKRKLATQTSGFTDDSAFVDYAKYVNALKSENRVNRRSTVVRYVELLDDIEAAWGRLSLREITTERIDNFISMLRKKGIVIIKAVALPTLELYKKQNRLGPAANDNLRSNVRGCSASAIARAAGLAQSTVSKALAGESVSKDTADKISAAMGYDTNVLFEVTESREPYAEKTLAEYFGYIQAVLSAAEKRGIISRNPARAAMHPSTAITTPRRSLTTGETDRAMELLSVSLQRGGRYSPLAIAAVISAWTGARRGEVAALSEDAIDREHMTITFSRALLYQGGEVYLEDTKNNVVHTSPLGDDLLQAIDDYIAYKKSKGIVPRGKFADSNFLLLNEKTGEPIHPDSITSWIKDFGAKELGIKDLNSYVFRHTVATRLHAAGLPLRAVADQIGDRLISTVDRHYINRLPEFHEQVRGALEDIYTYDGVPTVVKIIDSCIVRTDSGAHFDVAKLQAAIDNPDNWMDTDHLQIVLDHHEEYIEACGDDAGWIFIRADDYAVEHFGKIENG